MLYENFNIVEVLVRDISKLSTLLVELKDDSLCVHLFNRDGLFHKISINERHNNPLAYAAIEFKNVLIKDTEVRIINLKKELSTL